MRRLPPRSGAAVPEAPMPTAHGPKATAEVRTNIAKCLAATKEQLAEFEKVINPALSTPKAAIDSSIGTAQGDAWQVAYDAFHQLNNAMMHRIN